MAFLVYSRELRGRSDTLLATGEYFRLGGYNLIHKAWSKRRKPTNAGWHVDANELISLHTDGRESYDTRRLLIDFHPNANWRIGIVELLDVFVYTWRGNARSEAGWSPIMLRLRDVLYVEEPVTPAQKSRRIARLKAPSNGDDFVEFLYLNGDAEGWN